MKVSLAVITKDSAGYVDTLLQAGQAFADEIVVAVDASSTDATEAICARYADKLFRIEWDPAAASLEWALAWLNEQCAGDWIFRLDDDELPSTRLVEAIPRLIADRDITHYWLERRWLVGEDRSRWIAQYPLWPDWQLRLFRNVRSLVRVPGRLHTSYVVHGAPGHVGEGSIYHLDLVYHSDAQRRAKVERYERLSPDNGMPELYLPDEASLPTRPVPADDPPWQAASRLNRWQHWRSRLVERRAQPSSGVRRTSARDVSAAEIRRAGCNACEFSPELFRAALACTACPSVMTAGRIYSVDLTLHNQSPVAWPVPGLREWDVRITHRWLAGGREVDTPNALRTPLPRTLPSGETVPVIALVRAPSVPGEFVLQWDLLIENVSWFSAQGWKGPELGVRVDG